MAKKTAEEKRPDRPPMAGTAAGSVRAAVAPRGTPVVVTHYFHYAGEDVIWFADCRQREWIKYPTSDPVAKQLIQDAFATRGFRVTAFVFDGDNGPEASAVSIQSV